MGCNRTGGRGLSAMGLDRAFLSQYVSFVGEVARHLGYDRIPLRFFLPAQLPIDV